MPLPPENLLAHETSPYLLQHKDNPVHWRPWSRDALAEARELGKPVLLSVGYAACHWCHVMAHESFENAEIADVMNRLFVNIKVDREERPEIDQIYMAALTAMGEHGGWPMTMFLTPEGEPFWGGTYFPDTPRYGRPGFVQILNAVADAYREKSRAVSENAAKLYNHVQHALALHAPESEPALEHLDTLASSVSSLIDPRNGGLQGRQKFPSAPLTESLWVAGLVTGNDNYKSEFVNSLREMLLGGIYDHLGGGLCRYATDPEWLVPHFEKMLYDNAALIRHAIWAHAETGEQLFRNRIESTVAWLNREMTLSGGAFAASLDADSDGKEGQYYVWTKAEIEEILGADSEPFCRTYAVTGPGNWEGKNILHLRHRAGRDPRREDGMAPARARLLQARSRRNPPARDEKVIVDWNAMMIRALCEAGRYFSEPGWIEFASNAYDFISSSAQNGRLPHTITAGTIRFPGLLGDYASMILASIALFEATGRFRYLQDARTWFASMEAWHGDGEGSHYLTASDADDVSIRIRGDTDEAVISPTALTIQAVSRLSLAAADPELHERLARLAALACGRALKQNFGQAGIVTASALTLQPVKLLIGMTDSQGLVTQANQIPDLRRVDVRLSPSGRNSIGLLPDGSVVSPDSFGAYLCAGPVCYPPITDPAELRDKLLSPFP